MSRTAAMSRTAEESASARTSLTGSAPGHRAHDSDLRVRAQRFLQPASAARVHAVDVHVDEPPQFPRLVEEKVLHRQLSQRVADGRSLELESFLPACLC